MNDLKTVSLDGVEYPVETMTDQQKMFVSQLADINQKLGNLQFQADQLAVAKEAFVGMLKKALEQKPE